jgi:RNA polymerase sigma-70 factor, ECF subfamily
MLTYQLLAGFNKRDSIAVEEVWQSFYPALIDYISKLIHSPTETEDLAAEAFTKLLCYEAPFESLGNIRGYLFTSAKNMALNFLTHKKTIMENTIDLERHIRQLEPEDIFEAEAYAELIAKVCRAIDRLNPKCKQVFCEYYTNRLKNREIAEKLGISEKTVEKRKTVAFRQLKMEIRPQNRFILSILFL